MKLKESTVIKLKYIIYQLEWNKLPKFISIQIIHHLEKPNLKLPASHAGCIFQCLFQEAT